MAQHKNCRQYDSCGWRKSVGYCPEECNHFKHKDEVVVVRCKDCEYSYKSSGSASGMRCRVWGAYDTDCECISDGYCHKGERRTE